MNHSFSTGKKILALALITVLIISQTACGSNNSNANNNQGVSQTNFVLDTLCTLTIYALDNSGGRYSGLSQEELREVEESMLETTFYRLQFYENMFSNTIETSPIYEINHAEGKPVQVNDEVYEVINLALQYAELSEGAFDITCGTETALWDFRGNAEAADPTLPSDEAIQEAVKHVDYTKVKLDPEKKTVQLLDPEMQLDLGGIAKGYIAGRIAVFMEDIFIRSGVVDLGGNIVLINGKSPSTLVDVEHQGLEFDDFKIGVTDPDSKDGGILGSLDISGKTLVTSGTYARCFTVDGVTYHHILDPKTGYPIDTDVKQVTIIAKRSQSTDADALATVCLELGVDKGMKIIESMNNVEAIFVDTHGKIHYTDKDNYKLKK